MSEQVYGIYYFNEDADGKSEDIQCKFSKLFTLILLLLTTSPLPTTTTTVIVSGSIEAAQTQQFSGLFFSSKASTQSNINLFVDATINAVGNNNSYIHGNL